MVTRLTGARRVGGHPSVRRVDSRDFSRRGTGVAHRRGMKSHRNARIFTVIALALAAGCDAQPLSRLDPKAPIDPHGMAMNPNNPSNPSNPSNPNPSLPPVAGLPCSVDQVLAAKCRDCHGAVPSFGAPMPLVTYADLVAPAKSAPNKKVYELVGERIVNESRPMPPTEELASEERVALYAWLNEGAPSGEMCDPTEVPIEPNPPEPIGPDALPCTPTHEFRAHGGNTSSKYRVPASPSNQYQCFTFRSPFTGNEYGTAWAPLIDDSRVLHHWILYKTKTPQVDGGSGPCQMPGDAQFVAGWAPGGQNYVMPDDVSLELPGAEDFLILQMHYHNGAAYSDAEDSSGVALCTSNQPRTNTAGFFTLGSLWINIPPYTYDHDVVGECPSWVTSYLPQSVTVLGSFPHMHQRGERLKTEIFRGGPQGSREMLVEVERFDFENQRVYPNDPPFVINPGDMIRTTCTFSNPTADPIRFGERTEDEMCFNFVLLYPIAITGAGRQCGVL
jgi:hypothetical protein